MAIVVLMVGTKLGDDTPAILYKSLMNAAWMAPIIMGIIAVIPIYLLMQTVSLYPGKNLMDIIIHLFGKYIGFFVLFILWIEISIAIIIDSAIYTDIIGTMYFNKTPTIVIYGLLMLVCAYGAKRGLEQIGSVAWSLIPYIKGSLFIAFILTLTNGQLDFLFPVFGPGELEVIKQSSMKLSIFTDFLFLFFLIPYIKSSKDFKKGTWIALAIVVVELTIAIASYVLLFDYNSVKLLNYPYHEVIRYLQLGVFSGIETFFFPFWLIATFIRFAAYLYLSALLFGSIFKVKHFEYVIPTLATLIVFIGMIPETPTFTIFNLRVSNIHLTTPIFFFLPCLLWVTAKIKGDFKNEKANTTR